MLQETGTVVKIEPDVLWVETLQKSACGSCNARSGCGQHVLGEALADTSIIRVLLNGKSASDFRIDQQVVIGIPEDVVVKGALLVYLLPLVVMLGFVIVGYQLAVSDVVSAVFGGLGLVLGGVIVRRHSRKHHSDPLRQPIFMGFPL